MTKRIRSSIALVFSVLLWGCTERPAPLPKPAAARPGKPVVEPPKEKSDDSTAATRRTFQPVQLGEKGGAALAAPAKRLAAADEKRTESVVAALQPFQALLGRWRWITRKKFGNSARSGEDLEWTWDFQTDPNRPALRARSDSSPYFQTLWLTWLPADERFQLTIKSAAGDERSLEGFWAEQGAPREESDGKTIQHIYKLRLTQVHPDAGDQMQATLSQLDNNQYLVDFALRPASGRQYGHVDSVRQQRLGTSFAVAGSDNPGPKCIISGGLGTMSVEYQGKSYPVCCTGCAAAFRDDPERWLAKLALREKNKKPHN